MYIYICMYIYVYVYICMQARHRPGEVRFLGGEEAKKLERMSHLMGQAHQRQVAHGFGHLMAWASQAARAPQQFRQVGASASAAAEADIEVDTGVMAAARGMDAGVPVVAAAEAATVVDTGVALTTGHVDVGTSASLVEATTGFPPLSLAYACGQPVRM